MSRTRTKRNHAAGRYDAVARTLHWTMAALILANLPLGLLHDALKPINVMPLHKSIGLSVLVLAVVRIAWRLSHAAPPLPSSMGAMQRRAAAAVHGVLYLMMLAMPLTGWAIASAGKYPLSVFGIFDWPKLAVVKHSALYGLAHQMHGLGGWLMLALLAGHVGAALWHQSSQRDAILRRMV